MQQKSYILGLSTTLFPKSNSVTNPALVHCVQAVEVHFAAMIYL